MALSSAAVNSRAVRVLRCLRTVVTHAELMLDVQVSPDMAARNATLQLMLNGQPLGTVPLGTDGRTFRTISWIFRRR